MVRERGDIVEIELDVPAVADPGRRDAHVAEVTARAVDALGGSDALLYTSRTLLRSTDPSASLEIARQVSTAVTTVVRGTVAAEPAWVVAKGGITSTMLRCAAWAFGARRSSVNSCPGSCPSSGPSRPSPRSWSSARPTSCSPATSATRPPWLTSLSSSAAGRPTS